MKKIKFFYHTMLKDIKDKKQLFFSLILPLTIIFCCTLILCNGILVAALGSRAQVTQELPSVQEGIANQILRLHVIANSDSQEDQAAKYIVKDGLLNIMQSYLSDATTKEESMQILSNHLSDLENQATQILRCLGFSHDVRVTLGKASFPIKVYGDVNLPAGEYDALRVHIGSSQGKNWWCIIFPNLCYVDDSYQIVPEESKDQLKTLLTEEEYDTIISSKKPKLVVKSKLWEWIKTWW